MSMSYKTLTFTSHPSCHILGHENDYVLRCDVKQWEAKKHLEETSKEGEAYKTLTKED